jgi:hypothetical protein
MEGLFVPEKFSIVHVKELHPCWSYVVKVCIYFLESNGFIKSIYIIVYLETPVPRMKLLCILCTAGVIVPIVESFWNIFGLGCRWPVWWRLGELYLSQMAPHNRDDECIDGLRWPKIYNLDIGSRNIVTVIGGNLNVLFRDAIINHTHFSKPMGSWSSFVYCSMCRFNNLNYSLAYRMQKHLIGEKPTVSD